MTEARMTSPSTGDYVRAARVTRKLEIDAGHRLLEHEGKCRRLHGHRYVFEVTAQAARLDSVGRVIDFSVIKEKVGGWLESEWDHRTLVHYQDVLAADDVLGMEPGEIVPVTANPTAENMAYWVFVKANELLQHDGVEVVKVVCHETPNCWAVYP